MTLPTTGQIWPVGAIPCPEPPSFTIAGLPITTSREAPSRSAQLVVDLGISGNLTADALPITTARNAATRVAQLAVELGLPGNLSIAATI